MVFAIAIGIPAGVLAAQRRGSVYDHTIMGAALTGYSMPIFWWGLLLVLFFSLHLGWTPVSGRIDLDYYFEDGTNFMLYDALVRDLNLAEEALRGRPDLRVVNDRLVHAQAIVLELQAGLDPSKWSGGPGLVRLYNYLQWNQVLDCEKRMKLAFACLLTAVGIPQVLAGDEFADQHDLLDEHGYVSEGSGKQIDPVNYSRLKEDWRRRIKE